MAFLDFIVNWVNDPTSERSLVLFGLQAPESHRLRMRSHVASIKMHRLTSSYIFLRKEQSEGEVYHLFTALARDLSDRSP